MADGRAHFGVIDERGNACAALSQSDQNRVDFLLFDDDGWPRIGMHVGRDKLPSMRLVGPGRSFLSAGFDENTSVFSVADRNGAVVRSAGLPPAAPARAADSDVLLSKGFALQDANGAIRATLTVEDEMPWLMMYARDGKRRLALGLSDKEASVLQMLGPDEQPVTGLLGQVDAPGLVVSRGGRAAMVSVFEDKPSFMLFGSSGQLRAILQEREPDAASLSILGKDSRPQVILGIDRQNSAQLRLEGENGESTALMTVLPSGDGTVAYRNRQSIFMSGLVAGQPILLGQDRGRFVVWPPLR